MRATPPTPAPMPAFAAVLRPLELLVDVSADVGVEEDVEDAVGVPGEEFVAVGSYLRISTVLDERAGASHVDRRVFLVFDR